VFYEWWQILGLVVVAMYIGYNLGWLVEEQHHLKEDKK